MTALALESPAMSAPAFVRAHWRAAVLVGAMLVLWVFAGISLALNGSGPGFNSPLGRTTAPPAATARLRAQAEQMSATQLKQIAPPGTRASYSQAGYNLAGRIAEKVTGLTYERAVASLVVEPLGLSHSFFARDEVMTRRFAVATPSA